MPRFESHFRSIFSLDYLQEHDIYTVLCYSYIVLHMLAEIVVFCSQLNFITCKKPFFYFF